MKKLNLVELTAFPTVASSQSHEIDINEKKKNFWKSYESGEKIIAKKFSEFQKNLIEQVKSAAKKGEKEVKIEIFKMFTFEFGHLPLWSFALFVKCLDFVFEQDLIGETCEIWDKPVDDTADSTPKAVGVRVSGW
jgi:hypothetical protein